MAIYTPRGRRTQDAKQPPDGTNETQPSKNASKKDILLLEQHTTPHSDRRDTEKHRRSSGESASQHRASRVPAEERRERPEEPKQSRMSRAVMDNSREEPGLHRQTRVFTAKNREHSDEHRQHRAHRTPAERSQRLSEGSDRASAAPQSKAASKVVSESITNGHGPPRAAASPPAEPKRRSAACTGPGSDERAIDLTVRPVDLSTKPAESAPERGRGVTEGGDGRPKGAPSPPTERRGDRSPGGRRRPRGATGVYVPRAARRHCDSGGEQPSEAAVPARQDRGDTAEGRPSGTRSQPGPDVNPPLRTAGRRRRDSDKATGRGAAEKKRTASPQANTVDEKREPARKEPPAAQSSRNEGVRTSSSRAAARVEGRETPPAPVSRPRVADRCSRAAERQREPSPPETELAGLALEPAVRQPPVPAVRRGVRTEPTETAPSSGLLYVPGGPHSDPPEPPLSHTHSHPESHSRPHPQPQPQPPPRLLFDPNNPGRALEVTPRAADSRERRYQEASRTYSEPYSGGGSTAAPGWSDPYSLPANSTNASRISQLLGRAAGEMEYLIASGRLLNSWTFMARVRAHVQTECARVLVSDLRTWMTLGIDQTIWKSLYYCVIEELRLADIAEQHWALHEIIDEGMDYFTGLMTTLQQTYDIPIPHLSSLLFDPETVRRKRYFSSVAALSQRLLLCLGDLTRYQHHLGRLPNLVQAHSFYLQAQQMNPKNGRPFNQLAIVALHGHRRLDCVYLYARALMAANPFHTAKESLLSLFHESSRRFAARSPMPGQLVAPAADQREERRGADLRAETWVHPGRGDRLQRTLRTEEDLPPEQPELRGTPDTDLLKAFTTTYLHVQGKLYTRVSLETYQEDACVMLRQFSELLSREPMPLKSADMLHILGINMFNIANTKLKDERLGSELRSTYQELALAVAIEMAGHVIQRTCQLLSALPPDGGGSTDRLFQPYALETCMVFVKVWCDWLLSSSAIWNPPPCTADYRVSGVADSWESLAELTNLLRRRDDDHTRRRPSNILSTTSSGEQTELVVRLPEDSCLQSFTPLLCGEHRTAFVDREQCSLERARDLLRLRCVLFVTEQFLCGTEPAALRLLKTADGACRYVSQVSSHAAAGPEDDSRPDSPDVEVEWSREEEQGEGEWPAPELPSPPVTDAGRPELVLLQRQKLALERRARRQEEHSRRVQAIVSSAHVSVTMEVRPRYLVADTNCYVDYLEQLEDLVNQHSAYTLTVPVTGGSASTAPSTHLPCPSQVTS